MFWQIVSFEIKYRLKRPATYIYFFLFLVLSFALVAMPNTSFSESGDKINNNAPVLITQLSLVLMVFGSLVCAAIMGVPVFRDYDHKFNEIMHSLPVKRWEYLWGRFTGSYLISLIIFSGITLGMMLGFSMPWQDSEAIGPFQLAPYISSFLYFVVPNLFILGSLFFIVGSYFRSQTAIYAQGILFVALFMVIDIILIDIDRNPLYCILDPFGSEAIAQITEYWTPFEKNTFSIGLSSYVLLNRILWVGLAGLASIMFTLRFNPTRSHSPLFRQRNKKEEVLIELDETLIETIQTNLSLSDRLFQGWHLARFYFKSIIRSVPFFIILLTGIGFMLLLQLLSGKMYGTSTLPVTYMLLDTLSGGFMLFLNIIIIVYSGEIIWKDISSRFSLIIDSSPLSNTMLLLSKFSAMVLVELLLMLVIILSGIGVQIVSGFYDFQFGIYIKYLMLNLFPTLFLMTFLTFFVHTLVNNKFLGHGIVILIYLTRGFHDMLGLNHALVKYGQAPTQSFSGMNGLHKFITPALTLDFYWLFWGIVLLGLTLLYIKRGTELNLRIRNKLFQLNWRTSSVKYLILGSAILILASGFTVYYNTNMLNEYRSKKEQRKFSADYEKKYRRFEDCQQPRIIDVNVNVDIFPNTYKAKAIGTYTMVNKNQIPLDSIHLRFIPEIEINRIHFGRKTELVDNAPEYGYYIHRLDKPLQPGDTLKLQFAVSYQEEGFANNGRSTEIVPNGTFFHQELLPWFGYDESFVLQKKKDREKEGLEEREFEAADLMDSTAYADTYISRNADRISYEAIVSTIQGQTALTCGNLVDDWIEGNRHYFHYKMNEPIWNFVPFLSAKYAVKKDHLGDIALEIYYHPEHDYNLDKMMEGMKKTIAYCDSNFYPYQHNSLRIVEFPRYNMYAQSFPGIIPFSEGIGFILDVDEDQDIDIPFEITAHEVAHQWWGHHVCAADVKGKLMLVESLANYTALMVMEHEYGEKNIGKFLKYEQDNYLLNRGLEHKKEVPLYLVDDQTYIGYNKGSLAFYAMRKYLGEEKLNNALKRFVKEYSYKEAPYPTSIDLLAYLEEATPDSLQYLLDDMFRTITIYSNRIDSGKYALLEDGKYQIDLYATTKKYLADSLGKQEKMIFSDWVDVGVYAKDAKNEDSLVYLTQVQIDTNQLQTQIMVDFEPSKVGIDPLHLLIDRNLGDNIKTIKSKS